MTGRVARRRALTRERIFTEAMRLFAERGFDAVTVADIAEAADIGKGTFFTHFPSKRDVFAFHGEQVVSAMAAAAETAQGSTRQRLAAVFHAAVDYLESHPEPSRQMASSRSFNVATDFGSPNQRGFAEIISQILADGVTTGGLRADLPVVDAVSSLQCNYYMCVLTWASGLDPRPLRERMDAMLDLALGGMSASHDRCGARGGGVGTAANSAGERHSENRH